MTVDIASLSKEQKQAYDFWKLTRGDETEELEELLASLAPKARGRKPVVHEDKEKVSREAEAVLLHLRRVGTLLQKECLECHRPFATNYAYVGRCSDDCIKASLHAVGIEWDVTAKTAQERWNGPGVNGEVPAIISPETLIVLKNWARAILSWDENPEHRNHLELHEQFARLLNIPADTPIEWKEPVPMTRENKEKCESEVRQFLDSPPPKSNLLEIDWDAI